MYLSLASWTTEHAENSRNQLVKIQQQQKSNSNLETIYQSDCMASNILTRLGVLMFGYGITKAIVRTAL